MAVPTGEISDELPRRIIGAAIEVHRVLGPGLNEALYEAALGRELAIQGLQFERQKTVDGDYKGAVIGQARIDLLVEEQVIVELKAVEAIHPVHRAQCISYLSITGCRVALLINFNVLVLKDGVKRVVL